MLNKEKGITLIALIITIIVMLILVGVTVNIALNGGLFTKADDAKESTQLAMDKEELQMEIVTAYDEDNKGVDLETLKDNLEKKGWKDIIITGDKLTCTSPKGNTFTVDGVGKVTEIPNNDDDDDDDNDNDDEIVVVDKSIDLERYFFDESGEGKTGLFIENSYGPSFNNDPDTIADASTSILMINYSEYEGWIKITYQNSDYMVDVDLENEVAILGADGKKVTKLENETYPEGMSSEERKVKKYFTGYSGQGANLYLLLDYQLSDTNKGKIIFKNNDIIPDASEKLLFTGENENYIRIIYNSTIYKVQMNEDFVAIGVTKEGVLEPKEYPAVYSVELSQDVSPNAYIHIIETSDIESIFVMGNLEGAVAIKYDKKRPCTNLKDAKQAYSNLIITHETDLPYDQVMVTPEESVSTLFEAFTYFPSVDAWGMIGTSSENNILKELIVNGPGLYRNNNLTEQQINEYIELADQLQS